MPKPVLTLPISNILGGGLLIACLAGTGVLFMHAPAAVPQASPIAKPAVSASPSAMVKPTATPGQGSVKLIANDLGLFIPREEDGFTSTAKYYDAGMIKGGAYTGYQRVVAVQTERAPGGSDALLFATRDNLTYIVDTDSLPNYVQPRPSFKELVTQYSLNPAKVSKEAKLIDTALMEVQLSSDISLRRIGYQVDMVDQTSKKGGGSFDSYGILVTDFSKLSPLKSPLPGYTAYYQPIGTAYMQSQILDVASAFSVIILVDDQGLATKLEYENHTQTTFIDQGGVSRKSEVLDFAGDKIVPENGNLFYSEYGATRVGCGSGGLTEIVKDVTSADLALAGTFGNTDFYRFINPSNKLSHLAYNYKFSLYGSDEEYAKNNNGAMRPTFAAYVSKNPTLLFKDYWGRYVSITEVQYPWIGGCGKPVVYLYPTKPTDVSLSFTGPIKLDVNIPTYDNGWKVLAQSDGTLTDLQPAATDCAKLPVSRFGAEYAAAACQNKTYPYIFWSGSAGTGQTASRSDGWTVSSTQLKESLEAQLVTAGLKEQERSDMLSYWVPTMLRKNAPYYRFAFLQTAEMNRIAPMQVTPTPDTTYRLFLTWSPEQSLPPTPLQPEFLPHLIRKGFTLVEWGGLER